MPDEKVSQDDQADSATKLTPESVSVTTMAADISADRSDRDAEKHTGTPDNKNPPPSVIQGWWKLHVEKLKNVGMHEWIMVAATVAMAISTCIYTYFANKQLRTMIADQRPWIGPPQVALSPDHKLNMTFQNYGKTPTTGLWIDADIVTSSFMGTNGIEAEKFCTKGINFAKKNGGPSGFQNFVLVPGSPHPLTHMPSRDLRLIKPIDFPKNNTFVAGCVVYGWSDDPHSTGFLIEFEISNGTLNSVTSYAVNPTN